jgi:prepilin-type N-terminal cleavage/methylation domain-containing protein
VNGRRKVRRRGFTLIEALLVIVIMGLVAAFAIPKLRFASYQSNAGARSLAGLLAQAQRLAVTDQNNVNVIFNLATNSVMLHEDANNDNAIQPTERVRTFSLGDGVAFGLGGAPARVYTPPPITFTHQLNGMPELIFYRDGSASENGAVYLTSTAALLTAKPQDARSIEVILATGRAEWYQYTGSAWVRKF